MANDSRNPSPTDARIASSPPLDPTPLLSATENPPIATKNPTPELPESPPIEEEVPPGLPESAPYSRDPQTLPHLPSPHASTPPPDTKITVTFPTPTAPARDEHRAPTVLGAEAKSSTDPSFEAGIQVEGAGAISVEGAVEPLPSGAVQAVEAVEALSDELGESSKEDFQVEASEAVVEQEIMEGREKKEEGEVIFDTPQQPMSFLDTLEAFVATSPGACELQSFPHRL